jgi:hypothetical protein
VIEIEQPLEIDVAAHAASRLPRRGIDPAGWNAGNGKAAQGQATGAEMSDQPPILTCDSATKLDGSHRGGVVVCGSHGGVYPAYLAARAGLRALLLNDAGVGLERAGIGCLDYCQALGMACATIGHASARIGDAEDMRARGLISHANPTAADLGIAPGTPTGEALGKLGQAPVWRGEPAPYPEGRQVVGDRPGKPRVVCIDSASMVEPADTGQIVITGSHGGLVASRPDLTLQVDALLALFNDAGVGIDEAGIARLPLLDERGIAAATVAAMTARIGDGVSTYRDGVLSRVNDAARRLGARPGMRAQAFVAALAGA